MKYLSFFLCAVFGIVSFAGCKKDRKPIDHIFKWESIDCEFDSLMLVLEYKNAENDNYWQEELKRMREISDSLNMSQIKARMNFWEGMASIVIDKKKYKYSIPFFEKALELSDSAQYPFDYFRIKEWLYFYDNPQILLKDKYDFYNRLLKYSKEINSYLLEGDAVSNLTYIEAKGGLDDLAYQHSLMSQESYNKLGLLGLKEYSHQPRMNTAVLLSHIGKTMEADSIFKLLQMDSLTINNPGFLNIVLMNRYSLTRNIDLIYQAYEIVKDKTYAKSFQAIDESIFAFDQYNKGNLDSARYWIESAYMKSFGVGSLEERKEILDKYITILSKTGELENPDLWHQKFTLLSDSVQQEKHTAELAKMAVNREISEYINMKESEKKLFYVKLGIVLLAVFIFIVVFIWYLRERHHKEINKNLKAEIELEKSRRENAALSLIVEEKNNVLQTVESMLSKIPASAPVSDIEKTLKIHKAGNEEWDQFQKFFSKIHPRFEDVLRKNYGIRSEKQIKLACYIWMGLHTKQIARLLNLEAESVNKNRYRLRMKLGLTSDQSLEEALHDIGDKI